VGRRHLGDEREALLELPLRDRVRLSPEEDEPCVGDVRLGAAERGERLRTASSSGQPNTPDEMRGKATLSAPSSSATASELV
jgi:hypothetical protein